MLKSGYKHDTYVANSIFWNSLWDYSLQRMAEKNQNMKLH